MWRWIIFNAVWFYVFVPGVVIRLPPHGSMLQQALVHAVIFGIVHHIAGHAVKQFMREGMENPTTKVNSPCPPGYEQCGSGDCRLASEVHTFCN
jgi:hypothetical protein